MRRSCRLAVDDELFVSDLMCRPHCAALICCSINEEQGPEVYVASSPPLLNSRTIVGDVRHARYAFGERRKRLVLLRRADQSPQTTIRD